MGNATDRRGFLKLAGATAGSLVIGLNASGALAKASTSSAINPFVRIDADGTVTAILKHFEMGQGTTTGLATLIAEELDADWDALKVEFAPADSATYGNLLFGAQGTGGSTAIANSFMQYRQAAAAAREMLVAAAAKEWGVAPDAITVKDGMLHISGRSTHFGQFAAAAAELEPPAEPKLKAAEDFTFIGRDHLPRKDSKAKTDGSAIFAIDVSVPGMVHAVTLRPPRFGGKLVSFDAAEAADVPGFVDAKALPNGAGVVVYAGHTWAAMQARDAISAEWDFAEAENRSTDALTAYHKSLLDKPTYQTRKDSDLAGTTAAIEGAAKTIEAEFLLPNLAHAPMEPLNCIIAPTADGVRVHDGCQFPGITQPTVAAILGLEPGQVEVSTVYAGGSFGRRATPGADYQAEAAMAFDLLGREKAVKLVWTREDDVRGGYYRPMAAHRARIGLDADGKIVGWDHRIAAKSILKGTPFEAVAVHDGVDHASVEGIADTPYAVPGLAVGLSDAETQIPVLWWRAVGHTHTAYAMESLLDMAAEAAEADPLAFRLAMLDGDAPEQKRLAGVLRLAAEKAGWGGELPEGRARGIAAHYSFKTFVAEVAEVSVTDGIVKVEKVVCAVDCGIAVNPDVIRAQMEGGIGYGLGAVMRNAITLSDGEVDQSNFPDYEPLRMADMPEIETHIVPSSEAPTGVGEPGLPPIGPAVANAIFAATGKRVTHLPMTEAGIEFA